MSFNLEHIDTSGMLTQEEAHELIVDPEYQDELTVCLPVDSEALKTSTPESGIELGFVERFGCRLKADGTPYTNYRKGAEIFNLMIRKQREKFYTLPKAVIVRMQLGDSAIEAEFVAPVATMGQQSMAVKASFTYSTSDVKINQKRSTKHLNRITQDLPRFGDNPYVGEGKPDKNEHQTVHNVIKHKTGYFGDKI